MLTTVIIFTKSIFQKNNTQYLLKSQKDIKHVILLQYSSLRSTNHTKHN